jgi:hypothetical protein
MNKTDYRATEIISNGCTCPLSFYSGQTLLLSEFSALQEEVGSNPNCQCQFKHYADRRHLKDRRKLDIESLVLNTYRRAQPFGRRIADKVKKLNFEQMLDQAQFI